MGMEMDDDMFMNVFSKMFDGYSRSIYVHTFGEKEEFVSKAKKFADDLIWTWIPGKAIFPASKRLSC